ncbi:MAG: TetR family transcriptional regulator [Rhodospirillales bacterium]|nr:TetR family transcriptional regulator [Rhodospirillales bacterium]
MTDQEFETALVDAAFALGAEAGWLHVSPAAAARHAGLDLPRAHALFTCTGTILKKFGRLADAAALSHVTADGSVRDKLFDILLRRFDYLQPRRAGVLALMRVLPLCPPLALAMGEMNLISMGWLLEAAGVDATGVSGIFKRRGLLAVWLYGLRAWARDESPDLTATMAAVDTALARAENFAERFSSSSPSTPEPFAPEPEAPAT